MSFRATAFLLTLASLMACNDAHYATAAPVPEVSVTTLNAPEAAR